MPFKRGLWLTLLDEAGEATPIACEVDERRPGTWVLEAMVPPQVYPVTFVAAELVMNSQHIGLLRLPEPVTTVTHQPLELRLEFPVKEDLLARAVAAERRR
jgi:hypothetical protein